MAVSQATMVAVMTMTPVHMKLHGHESLSPYVISVHIGGMFAFSPLVGRYVDRRGSLSTVQVGAAILVAATLLASTAGITEWLLFPALWALGLGWNFGLLGGSAMLIESVDSTERVAVQGTSDLTMSLCGAVAGFSSGSSDEPSATTCSPTSPPSPPSACSSSPTSPRASGPLPPGAGSTTPLSRGVTVAGLD